jgi:hypothetical protein
MQILTGRLPFHHLKHDSAVIIFITKHGRPLHLNSPEITDDVWSVLERSWSPDPKAHPSIASLTLFFDITNTLASSHSRLASPDIAQLLASSAAPRPAKPGRNSLLGRFSSLKQLCGTGGRQRRNHGNDIPQRRLSLPGHAPKMCVDVDTGQPMFHYYCNWPECPEGFDTLGKCQTHEMGHRQWAPVSI